MSFCLTLTLMHTYSHTCSYTHTHICTYMPAHTYSHVHAHMHVLTHMHTRTQHTCTFSLTHVHVLAHIQTHTCSHTYSHARTHVHTYTHTHTRTCTGTHLPIRGSPSTCADPQPPVSWHPVCQDAEGEALVEGWLESRRLAAWPVERAGEGPRRPEGWEDRPRGS